MSFVSRCIEIKPQANSLCQRAQKIRKTSTRNRVPQWFFATNTTQYNPQTLSMVWPSTHPYFFIAPCGDLRLARRSYMREKNWDFSGACVAATPDTVGFCGRDGSFESGHNSKKNRTYPAIIRIPKIRTNQNSVAFVLTFSIRSTHRFPNLYIKHKPSTSLFSFQVHLFRFLSQVRDGQERTSNGWGWIYRDSHGSSAAQGGVPRVHHRQPW